MNTNNRFTLLETNAIHDAQLGLEWATSSIEVANHQAGVDAIAAMGDDWRMPTVDELASLVDRSRAKPACDPVLNMPWSYWHWSSSPVVGWPEGAWFVGFDGGVVGYHHRGASGVVRPVRDLKR